MPPFNYVRWATGQIDQKRPVKWLAELARCPRQRQKLGTPVTVGHRLRFFKDYTR